MSVRGKANKRRHRQVAYLMSAGRCHYCGTLLAFEDMTLDHLLPKAKGGQSIQENLVCACKQCNVAKQTMSVEEFKKLRESLNVS